MIDALSVERNFVLVNSNLIGGPNEKSLPPKYFSDSVKKILFISAQNISIK